MKLLTLVHPEKLDIHYLILPALLLYVASTHHSNPFDSLVPAIPGALHGIPDPEQEMSKATTLQSLSKGATNHCS
jgi:hypothetical protein